MNGMLKILAVLVAVLFLSSVNAYAGGATNSFNKNTEKREYGRAGGTSSPPVEVAGNGDRVSHYPPYFHPTR